MREWLGLRWRRAAAVGLGLWLVFGAAAVGADEVTSKGTVLRGKVTGISAKTLTLEPEYGAGSLVIEWEDVEAVSTDGDLQILHGEELELIAPIAGRRGDVLVVGEQEVEIATIFTGVAVGPDGPSWQDRLRSQWRYWDGYFDLGFTAQRSTTSTRGLTMAFETTRAKGPTRLLLGASYRFGTEDRRGAPETTTQNELKGLLRGDYDITERIYGFASVDGEYDEIERLSVRSVPKVGAGYTIFIEDVDEKRQNFLRAEGGGGWVYQKYFGGDEDDYFTIALGVLAKYHLPYDSVFDLRFDYLPAVDDWARNYLLRTTASLTVPLFDPIRFKASVMDEYNNQPATGARPNSLFLTVGLSLGW